MFDELSTEYASCAALSFSETHESEVDSEPTQLQQHSGIAGQVGGLWSTGKACREVCVCDVVAVRTSQLQ